MDTGCRRKLRNFIHESPLAADELGVPSTGNKQTTTFVNLGDSLSIENVDSLIIPFTGGAGASQSASMILSDSTSLTLSYDDTNNTVIVGGSVYSSGDSIITMDRK